MATSAPARERNASAVAVDTGIDAAQRKAVAEGLGHLLADSYALLIKTHNYHWNVTGPMFRALHSMFQEQYEELHHAVDDIAERIRALGHMAPGSLGHFLELTEVEDETGSPAAEAMVRQLVTAHETTVRTARSTLASAEAAHDPVTVDLITQRMQAHEKAAWMLRSMIQ